VIGDNTVLHTFFVCGCGFCLQDAKAKAKAKAKANTSDQLVCL
jgi:hypothetical protein